MTVPPKEATANYVPAAAVIRKWRALSGITGRKAFVGGAVSWILKTGAQLRKWVQNYSARANQRVVEFPV